LEAAVLLQEEWAQRLEAAKAAAAQLLAEEVGKARAEVAEIESRGDLSAACVADLQSQVDSLQRQHATLADEQSTFKAETHALKVDPWSCKRCTGCTCTVDK